MREEASSGRLEGRAVEMVCQDGVRLGGDLWPAEGERRGAVIVNCATGVVARYYHRYARFLTAQGYEVLTWDYRGIGASRPDSLKGCGYRWSHWGTRDFEAALRFMKAQAPEGPLMVVGHSIGGFLPGMAESAPLIDRMLTAGAQYAWFPDYAWRQKPGFLLRWHLFMPAVTAALGYFPGKRLGWLEDLPAGVAYEWSFRGPRFETTHPPEERAEVVARMGRVRAEILAVSVTDDPFATPPALRRALRYYAGAPRQAVMLKPADYGRKAIGHFDLFHDRHKEGFWTDSLRWLNAGENPWPHRRLEIQD